MKALARSLERLGARVVIDADGDNLVRALAQGREISVDPPAVWEGAPLAEVCAQGLPNLLHEFVHVLLAARLDHDHGIDYQSIPFDLSTVGGREVLWDELSCAVVSCAYLDGIGARGCVGSWFAEQLEIQPVFYGLDGSEAFLREVICAISRDRDGWERRLALAYARAEACLRFGGASAEVARPGRRFDVDELMSRAFGAHTGR